MTYHMTYELYQWAYLTMLIISRLFPGLKYFLDNREKLFTQHDVRFGTNVENGYSYTGDQHYR